MSEHRRAIEELIEETLDSYPDADNRTKAARISEAVFTSQEGLRLLIEYLTARGQKLAES